MANPVGIVAYSLLKSATSIGIQEKFSHPYEGAAIQALTALNKNGWRIVKEGCRNPSAGMNCGCSHVVFAEEWTPDG